ncbi:redox-sensing transcriptional repressor Rex [candidate division KSB1 bacterium]|nr:redox-sensing transcriptional repressor Rex [candidate division KSB1 bacterium]
MQTKIPKPAVNRLCMLYRFLHRLENEGFTTISSSKIAEQLGLGSHNIRKDIGYLGEIGITGSGYDIAKLKTHISQKLGFDRAKKACVVGLGRLGSAIMNFEKFEINGYMIVAGFDSNINVLETIKTNIDVYPAYLIPDIVQRLEIELAVITVPESAAQSVAEKLIEGGIKGIVNFTPFVIKPTRKKIPIRNIDVIGEFDILSALAYLS